MAGLGPAIHEETWIPGSSPGMTVKEDEANVANIFGRIERSAWPELLAGLDERGYAVIPGLLSQRECRGVAALYEDETAFRSRVVMARHNFGRGEYK